VCCRQPTIKSLMDGFHNSQVVEAYSRSTPQNHVLHVADEILTCLDMCTLDETWSSKLLRDMKSVGYLHAGWLCDKVG